MGKNKWQNRHPQNNQNQAKVEQNQQNAPLAGVVDSAPVVEYCSEDELTSLLTLLDRLEESATMFGDIAVEAANSIIEPIRGRIETVGSISAEDQKQIDALKAEIEAIEVAVGARSPFESVSSAAFKALEEFTDPKCVKWRENQLLISEFGGDEKQQMSAADYKEAVENLAFQQVMAFVFSPVDMEGCPLPLVNIDTEFNAAFNEKSEVESEEPVQQIAAV